uniref:Uncharacterized protein n=1 Tax=Chlorocebus sabaeus TaxID=60711 RepID=A0A0D9S2J4_CHLSB
GKCRRANPGCLGASSGDPPAECPSAALRSRGSPRSPAPPNSYLGSSPRLISLATAAARARSAAPRRVSCRRRIPQRSFSIWGFEWPMTNIVKGLLFAAMKRRLLFPNNEL